MGETIKAIGWPHFAFFFGVFFVLIFRKPLVTLISRITSIDKRGVRASPTPEVQREEQKKESVQQLLLAIGDSIVLRELEGRIRADLQEKGLETDGDTTKVLIKHLAGTKVLLEFEQIHNLIFGSQIFLLKKLNEVSGQGKPADYVKAYFEQVKSTFPEPLGDWSLEQYLEFLIGRYLVTTKGNVFHVTNLGVEYLTWMIRNGKEEFKPL